MSKISHVLLENPVVVSTGTKLTEVAKLMKKNRVGSVLVSNNGKLVGIVTIGDVLCNFGKDVCVDNVMHSPEISIDSDKWITDVIDIFSKYSYGYVNIVEYGEKIGIIRADDILHIYRFKGGDNI